MSLSLLCTSTSSCPVCVCAEVCTLLWATQLQASVGLAVAKVVLNLKIAAAIFDQKEGECKHMPGIDLAACLPLVPVLIRLSACALCLVCTIAITVERAFPPCFQHRNTLCECGGWPVFVGRWTAGVCMFAVWTHEPAQPSSRSMSVWTFEPAQPASRARCI